MQPLPAPLNPKRNRRGLIILALIAVVVVAGFLAWNNPLRGRRLPVASVSRVPTQPLSTATPTPSQATPGPQGDQAAVPTLTAAPGPVCGGPNQLLVLALGIDMSAQADVIRMMRIDFVNQKVRVLSIPRDFWVPIPGFEEHGISMGQISATYGYGEHFNGEGKGNGVIATANTLYANYGVQFDRYMVIPMGSVAKWIDRVGGVDIVLDEPLDSGSGDQTHFNAGAQHLDGETALLYAWIQDVDTESERVKRQSDLLKILYARVREEMNLVQLTSLGVDVLADRSILTDLSARDITSLSCLGKKLTEADTEFVKIPKDMYDPITTEEGGSVLAPHPEVVPYIQEMMGVGAD